MKDTKRKLTRAQMRIRREYTELGLGIYGKECVLKLKSGVQSFYIYGPGMNKQERLWHQDMLAIAISNIVEREIQQRPGLCK